MIDINEIRARYEGKSLTHDDYKKLTNQDIARLRADIKRTFKVLDDAEAENAALREKLEAAIEDIKRMDRYIAKSDDPYAALCEVCKYKSQHGGKCKRCDVHDNTGFEWRGGQEVEKG